MSAAGRQDSLTQLAEEHVQIQSEFLAWLEAIVGGEAAAARARFETFDARLRAHAAMEEQFLLPPFRARGLESPGCSAAILLSEHAKIRRLLDRARAQLPPPGPTIPPAQRVQLVLDCHGLRELLDHHDQRERAGFFPALDAALSDAERAALYAICVRSQASAASREPSPPSSCNS